MEYIKNFHKSLNYLKFKKLNNNVIWIEGFDF